LPGFWVDSVLPASCRQNKIGTASKMLAARLPPFRQCARTGVNSVFAGQLLNAENRGGPQSVAPAIHATQAILAGAGTISVHGRQKFLFIKGRGGSKTVTMIFYCERR
jgi:hypothetical protein